MAEQLLVIDTAAPVVGLGLWSPIQERLWMSRAGRDADSAMGPILGEMLAEAETLVGVVVSVGPGAFTGLRVGVSMALGVATALSLPVVPVSSLEARAGLVKTDGRVLSILDARKQRFYAQWFNSADSQLEALSSPMDLPLSEVLRAGPFVAVGEGALVARESIIASGGQVPPDAGDCPLRALGPLGWLRRGEGLPPGEVAMRYLRQADAKKAAEMVRAVDASSR